MAQQPPPTPSTSATATPARAQSELDGRYALRRQAGTGGVCIVWEAKHVITGRVVAVKLLRPEYAQNPEARERLLREARSIGSVRHPNVVDVFDAGITREGVAYIVMEMLQGRSLEGLLAARLKLAVREAVGALRQTADALGAIHARGLVHRDVKPSNIFIVRHPKGGELAKLIDFGIVHEASTPEARKLTGPGMLIGTPEYMAPEQLMASPQIDARADVYALGVTLFECLTGEVPFRGAYQEVLSKVIQGDTPSLHTGCPEAPRALVDIVKRALERDPAMRYADGAAFARALAMSGVLEERAALLAGPPPPPTPMPAPPGASKHGQADADAPLSARSRRKYPRAAYVTPVRLIHGTDTIDGRSEDISERGLLFLTRNPLPRDARVQARFALPISGEMVSCPAVVRWVREAPRGVSAMCALGVEFSELTPPLSSLIERYIGLMGAMEPGSLEPCPVALSTAILALSSLDVLAGACASHPPT